MAGIRTIKPDFWTDEKIVELSPWARLFFIGLWNFCDYEGRMSYSEKRLKMQIFPADSIDVAPLCAELRRTALITVYEISGETYLVVNQFKKHQKIDSRRLSKLPPPPKISAENDDLRRTAPNPSAIREREREREREAAPKNGAVRRTSAQKAFTPPTVSEVRAYCNERGNNVDPEKFVAHYSASNWVRGKTKIVNWKACVITWEKQEKDHGNKADIYAPGAI